MITRRRFLTSTALAASAPLMLAAPRPVLAREAMRLRAEPVRQELVPGFGPTTLWGFNGATPGPIIRVRRGGRVAVQFENALPHATALHWHGLRIANQMDGVPGLTQAPVAPGSSFAYDFNAPDAGTWWYHGQGLPLREVAHGLYGALIADEDNPPEIDHDIVVFITDWRRNHRGAVEDDFDQNMHDHAYKGRVGNFSTAVFRDASGGASGAASGAIRRNQRVRLRFIGTATDKIMPFRLTGVEGVIVARDGMPLREPEAAGGKITLAPAQTVDIIGDITGDKIAFEQPARRHDYHITGSLAAGGGGAVRRGPIAPLPPNPYSLPDLASAVRVPFRMGGGAQTKWLNNARSLSGQVWTVNGKPGMARAPGTPLTPIMAEGPGAPLHRFQQGQSGVVEVANETKFSHALYLHGHHIHAVRGGRLSPPQTVILLNPGERMDVACVFNNPGKWLLHCRMLTHAGKGMATWVEVV